MQLDLDHDTEIGKVMVYKCLDCCKDGIVGTSVKFITNAGKEVYNGPITKIQDIYCTHLYTEDRERFTHPSS